MRKGSGVHDGPEWVFTIAGIRNCIAQSDIQYNLLAELTWGDIRDWALAMDVTPSTRTKRIGVLRTALDDAVDDG